MPRAAAVLTIVACLMSGGVILPTAHQGTVQTADNCGWPGMTIPGRHCPAWFIKLPKHRGL